MHMNVLWVDVGWVVVDVAVLSSKIQKKKL